MAQQLKLSCCLAAVVVLAVVGCASQSPGLAYNGMAQRPNLPSPPRQTLRQRIFHPGNIQQQRYMATIHDPYTDLDAGPTDGSTRPREYIRPLPEPVRSRLLIDNLWGFGPSR